MPLTKIEFSPGVVKDDTPLSSEGGWIDADKVRFRRGKPQVIGGWELVTTEALAGKARGMHGWADLDGAPLVGIGTHLKLYAYFGGRYYDATPNRDTGTLGTDPITTTNGSAEVSIADTAHGLAVGDYVTLGGATAVGGITVDGEYTVTSVTDANTYVITHTAAATSSATGGGASVTYAYEIAVGLADGTGGRGYGTGTYSTGTYSTASTGDYLPRVWSIDNWGENMLAVPRQGGLYEWAPDTPATVSAAVSGAPTRIESMFVAPERIVVLLGTTDSGGTYNPMLVRWSDQEDNTQWTAAAANLAGEQPLASGSKLIRGVAARGENLLWSDTALYRMVFTGDTALVFTFALIGTGCGLIGHNAVATKDGIAFWMGRNRQFYLYGGGAPQVIDCPVRRDVFDNLSAGQEEKVWAWVNSQHNEVWWVYPDSRDGNEVSRYVAFNYVERHWTVGTFDRTAWVDAGVWPHPLGVDASGLLYFHERGTSANGGNFAASLTSGYFDIGDGENLMMIRRIVPDFEDQSGIVTATLRRKFWPNGTETEHGTYTLTAATNKVDLRATARQMQITLESDLIGNFWRLGTLRMDAMPTGSTR